MIIEPEDVIDSSEGAWIRNEGTSAILVTIRGDSGQEETVEVPAGGKVKWYPPTGWRSATFNAAGYDEEFRSIEWSAAAG